MADTTPDSFPRASARTQKFTRGAPRSMHLDPTGERLLFVRSSHGTDPVGALWSLDVTSGAETVLADPRTLLAGGDEQLSPAERARRERSREGGGGIVAFATDRDAAVAAFALSSRLWVTDASGGARELPAVGAVIDPRPDPTGTWVAYAADGGLHVVRADGTEARTLAAAEKDDVAWGVAEFVAAEEMDRHRGYWWAPDGSAVLAARVDDSPVQRWYIADPAQPSLPANEVRYPVAGSADAEVTLHLLGLDGSRTDVGWDRSAYPYLVRASWSRRGGRAAGHVAGPEVGTRALCRPRHRDDVDAGRAVGPGLDRRGSRRTRPAAGRPARHHRRAGRRPAAGRRRRAGRPAPTCRSPRSCRSTTTACCWPAPTTRSRATSGAGRPERGLERLTATGRPPHRPGLRRDRRGRQPAGQHAAAGRDDQARRAGERIVTSYAEQPPLTTAPQFFRLGAHDLAVGLVLPRDHVPGTPLPVLMDPYGGPHHREVLDKPEPWLLAQWIADRGFAVVKVDGRGTGGRGPEWDRAVRDELASVTLDDQVEGLQALAQEVPDLDLTRVGIRGWSYGGYLAALAVLRRPDVFHAAVAGAPVTDMRLYDTFYTERYLGHPDEAPEVYERNSLIADAAAPDPPAADPARPGRRQRGGGAHPAAVRRAAGGRPAARRAAAERRDAHDAPGGRRREHPAAAGRVARAGPREVARDRRALALR